MPVRCNRKRKTADLSLHVPELLVRSPLPVIAEVILPPSVERENSSSRQRWATAGAWTFYREYARVITQSPSLTAMIPSTNSHRVPTTTGSKKYNSCQFKPR